MLSIRAQASLSSTVKFALKHFQGTSQVRATSATFANCSATRVYTNEADPREGNITPPLAAYLHLPFCKKKCFYCDFPVVAVGSALQQTAVRHRLQDYVDLLIADIHATTVSSEQPALQTVFFGGGTPTLIPPPLLQQVLDALHAKFGIAPDAEVSMEADPGTFDEQRLLEYMQLGVNRFSVGVQAFQQQLLEICGRSHSVPDITHALRAVTAAGPKSWSLDLISGLPGLLREQWQESLSLAIAAGAPHISIYDLQVEAGTPFGRWRDQGRLSFPDDSSGAAMYTDASAMLRKAGYEHYEVSNYAKPGHSCRHNLTYWAATSPYYAFGLGAASYVGGRRTTRPRVMVRYREWVQAGCDEAACSDSAQESSEEVLLDTVMLQLRLATGIDLSAVATSHGSAASEKITAAVEKHADRGLVHFTAGPNGETRCTLTDPEGFLLSNEIISDIFAAL